MTTIRRNPTTMASLLLLPFHACVFSTIHSIRLRNALQELEYKYFTRAQTHVSFQHTDPQYRHTSAKRHHRAIPFSCFVSLSRSCVRHVSPRPLHRGVNVSEIAFSQVKQGAISLSCLVSLGLRRGPLSTVHGSSQSARFSCTAPDTRSALSRASCTSDPPGRRFRFEHTRSNSLCLCFLHEQSRQHCEATC